MTIKKDFRDKCDCIYMLARWQKSQGACIEYGYAGAKKMMITFEKEEDSIYE